MEIRLAGQAMRFFTIERVAARSGPSQLAKHVSRQKPDKEHETRSCEVEVAPVWEGQRVRIEDLHAFKQRYGLRTVGGDPDLEGEPWMPTVYFVEAQSRR